MTRIVNYAHRYKRPPKQRNPVAIAGPVVVRKQGRADAGVPPQPAEEPTLVNDDRKPPPPDQHPGGDGASGAAQGAPEGGGCGRGDRRDARVGRASDDPERRSRLTVM